MKLTKMKLTKMKLMMEVTHLDGVAVDRLLLRELQDVVRHVAGRPGVLTHLPPLLPVIQDLNQRPPSGTTPPRPDRN